MDKVYPWQDLTQYISLKKNRDLIIKFVNSKFKKFNIVLIFTPAERSHSFSEVK